MIQLKSPREIEIMAHGGKILGATVEMLRREARVGMSTWQLDELAESFIRSHPGATPSFKGLYGFPGSVCASINEEIVHGIPSRRRVLKDGDIISIDVGVKFEGFHTDSATTVGVGEVSQERHADAVADEIPHDREPRRVDDRLDRRPDVADVVVRQRRRDSRYQRALRHVEQSL